MRKLVERGIVLELCPSSNLRTHAVADIADLRASFDRLRAAGVRMTINTDGTYLLGTTLRKEFDLLLGERIVSDSEAHAYIANAKAAASSRAGRIHREISGVARERLLLLSPSH